MIKLLFLFLIAFIGNSCGDKKVISLSGGDEINKEVDPNNDRTINNATSTQLNTVVCVEKELRSSLYFFSRQTFNTSYPASLFFSDPQSQTQHKVYLDNITAPIIINQGQDKLDLIISAKGLNKSKETTQNYYFVQYNKNTRAKQLALIDQVDKFQAYCSGGRKNDASFIAKSGEKLLLNIYKPDGEKEQSLPLHINDQVNTCLYDIQDKYLYTGHQKNNQQSIIRWRVEEDGLLKEESFILKGNIVKLFSFNSKEFFSIAQTNERILVKRHRDQVIESLSFVRNSTDTIHAGRNDNNFWIQNDSQLIVFKINDLGNFTFDIIDMHLPFGKTEISSLSEKYLYFTHNFHFYAKELTSSKYRQITRSKCLDLTEASK